MKRTKRNAEKSRSAIVEAASPIFNTYGVAGTRMDMIVDATGYQKGGIYQHFASKMDLAKACFWSNYKKLFSSYMQSVSEAETPEDQLIAFLRNYQYFVRHAPIKGGCPILNTAIEADDVHEDLSREASEALEEWISAVTQIIKSGQDRGQFKDSVEPREIAQYLISTIEGAIMIGKLTRDAKMMLRVGDQLIVYISEILSAD